MTTATLTKWGNSQGLIIPKAICDALGWRVGDKLDISQRADRSAVISAPRRKYQRSRVLTMEEVFGDYSEPYEPPADFDCVGSEIDWGGPAGREMW